MNDKYRKIILDNNITSQVKFWNHVKQLPNNQLSRKQAIEIYKDINTNSRQVLKNNSNITCFTGNIGCLQADLMDISRYKGHTKKLWILNIIDIYSRYAWSYPLNNKKPTTVLPFVKKTIEDVVKKHPNARITFYTDDGSEFKGVVLKYLKDNDHKYHRTTYKRNQSIVERFNRTLWTYFNNFVNISHNPNFLIALDSILTSYNNQIHSHHGHTPKDIYNKKEFNYNGVKHIGFVKDNDKTIKYDHGDFKIGDMVNVLLDHKKFAKKSFSNKFSNEVYQIIGTENNRFKLIDKNGTEVKKRYLARELIRAKNNEININNLYDESDRQSRFNRLQKQEKAFNDPTTHTVRDGVVQVNNKWNPKASKRVVRKPIKLNL